MWVFFVARLAITGLSDESVLYAADEAARVAGWPDGKDDALYRTFSASGTPVREPSPMRRNPEVGEIVTGFVRDWIGAMGVDHPDIQEAVQIVRDLDHLPVATRQLKAWFLDRLTTDPAATTPFTDLGHSLIDTALDRVDWQTIARLMRDQKD
jgi:hypothetical protein